VFDSGGSLLGPKYGGSLVVNSVTSSGSASLVHGGAVDITVAIDATVTDPLDLTTHPVSTKARVVGTCP
jgi:hypothetical protein